MSSMQVGGGSAWYSVPSSYSDAEAVPMVVTMHGSGDSPDNFVHWFPDANVPDTVITLTPGSADPMGWAETDIPIVLDAIDEMTANYNVDTCRIYLMGFSAGASMSYIIGLQHADEFAGFGSVAGTIQYAESWGIWPNEVPRKIAVDIHHGTLDGIEGARYSRDQLEGAGHTVYYTELQGVGHTVNAQMAAEMWANLKSHRLDE
jgi:poly(3-hydroxybutyrate) depolymerase